MKKYFLLLTPITIFMALFLATTGTIFAASPGNPVGTKVTPGQVGVGGWLEASDFGALGDGIHDDTKAIQTALNKAGELKTSIHLSKNKTYLVSSILIKNGTKQFFSEGTILGNGKSTHGILLLDGPSVFKGEAVSYCTVSCSIDMSAGDPIAIYADGCRNCVFDNINIYNFTDDTNKTGLLLWKGSDNNIISNCKIIGTKIPKYSQHLIKLIGNSLPFGDYFNNGNLARAVPADSGNSIINNYCKYGSHGIAMNGCEKNTVSGNKLEGQSHRSIALEPSCWYNTITSNFCLDYASSAVVSGYGCGYNTISYNTCKMVTTLFKPGGEASINCVVGNEGNIILGNHIDAPKNFGIYIAINGRKNIIENNDIKNYLKAGIALESDWKRPLIASALYSRPNFGASSTGKWAYGNTEYNEIKNNIIDAPQGAGASAIYLAQIGSTARLQNNTISGNIVKNGGKLRHYLYVVEETTSMLGDNVLVGNDLHTATPSQVFLSRQRGHFVTQRNNGIKSDQQ